MGAFTYTAISSAFLTAYSKAIGHSATFLDGSSANAKGSVGHGLTEWKKKHDDSPNWKADSSRFLLASGGKKAESESEDDSDDEEEKKSKKKKRINQKTQKEIKMKEKQRKKKKKKQKKVEESD